VIVWKSTLPVILNREKLRNLNILELFIPQEFLDRQYPNKDQVEEIDLTDLVTDMN
jgi:hypothetical protein